MKKIFNYDDCLEYMNNIISPNECKLPSIYDKNKSLIKINQYIRQYKLPMLYRYMPYNEYAQNALRDRYVYMVKASELNDAFEGAIYSYNNSTDQIYAQNRNIQDDIYIKSFTRRYNNNLMWSHYGNSHRGICIGYDFSKASEIIKEHLYPVQYSNVKFKAEDINNVAIHTYLYLRKCSEWKYEKEWRLIFKKCEMESLGEYLGLDCISEVYFGLRAGSECKEKVRQLTFGTDIKLYQIEQKKDSFRLMRTRI